jgi:hypothetical protein
VISDFGEGTIHTFLTSLDNARTALSASAVDGECGGDPLPFAQSLVVTQNQSMVDEYIRTNLTQPRPAPGPAAPYGELQIIPRDWGQGGSAWWDLCTAPVTTTWFMLVTSYFTFNSNFKLPIDVSDEGKLMPLIPFLPHDSPFCNRECRTKIAVERRIHPTFDRDFGQEFAVFNTKLRDEYCIMLQEEDMGSEPTVNGYFAFMEAFTAASIAAEEDSLTNISSTNSTISCHGVPDDALCTLDALASACTLDDEVGERVRSICKAACGTCISSAVAGSSARGEDEEASNNAVENLRESKPTNEWFGRKGLTSWLNASAAYKLYNHEKFFTVAGFEGRPVNECCWRQQFLCSRGMMEEHTYQYANNTSQVIGSRIWLLTFAFYLHSPSTAFAFYLHCHFALNNTGQLHTHPEQSGATAVRALASSHSSGTEWHTQSVWMIWSTHRGALPRSPTRSSITTTQTIGESARVGRGTGWQGVSPQPQLVKVVGVEVRITSSSEPGATTAPPLSSSRPLSAAVVGFNPPPRHQHMTSTQQQSNHSPLAAMWFKPPPLPLPLLETSRSR